MTHYYPILKTKQGELLAVKNIDASYKGRFTPVFELQEYRTDDPDAAPEILAEAIKIKKAWDSAKPIILDFEQAEAESGDGRFSLASSFLDQCQTAGLNAIPTVRWSAVQDWKDSVKARVTSAESLVCLRLDVDSIDEIENSSTTLDAAISALMKELGVQPNQVILILDYVDSVPRSSQAASIVSDIYKAVPLRSISISCTAVPRAFTNLSAGVNRIPRKEWAVWQRLRHAEGRIDFSDYTVTYPEVQDLNMAFVNPSAKIKYTSDSDYLMVKGAQIRGLAANAGYAQFRSMCNSLVSLPDFSGAPFSYGDKLIESCAGGGSTGNLRTWVTAGVNHHIMKVLSQI